MSFNKNIILIIILSIIFIPHIDAQTSKINFDVEQFLIRVQLKEGESLEKSIKITNTGLSDIYINITTKGLDSVVLPDKNSIKISRDSSEVINLKINGIRKEVFTGKLILSSAQVTKEILVVIEIESKNILFDVSISPYIVDKTYPSSSFSVDFSLINFMFVESASVSINYEIKDFDNNKILKENENLVVGKRASFIKTFKIPSNAKLASYALIAKVKYNESLGTTTYIFDVEKREVLSFLNGICKNNPICRVVLLLIFILLALLLIILKGLFRKKVISPKKMERIAAEKAKIQKKLDSLVEAYKSGFISKDAYEKSRKKLRNIIKNLNKK